MNSTKKSSSSNRKQPSEKVEVLHGLGPYDVLLGRGTGPNENQGNVRFREILKETMNKFTLPGYAVSKAQIAGEVMGQVKARNGNFVRKLSKAEAGAMGVTPVEPFQSRSKNALYIVVPDTVAMEKTKQSIRFQIKAACKNKDDVKMPIPPAPVTRTKAEIPKEKPLKSLSAAARCENSVGITNKVSGDIPQMPEESSPSRSDMITWASGIPSQVARNSTSSWLRAQDEPSSAMSIRIQDKLLLESRFAKEALERTFAHQHALEQYYAQILIQQHQELHETTPMMGAAVLIGGQGLLASNPPLHASNLLNSLAVHRGVVERFPVEDFLRSQATLARLTSQTPLPGSLAESTLLVLQAAKNNSLNSSLR